ncbi:MAG: hypothetical protein ABIO37_12530 [Caulobacteraceae bacterium]
MRVWFAALIAAWGLGGCVTQPELGGISVESSATSSFNPAKIYEVVAENEAQSTDPEFKNLALATRRMLQAAGLAVSPLTTSADADVRVTVDYGIGAPNRFSFVIDEPVYVTRRKATSTTERINRHGERVRTITSTPQRELAGFQPVTEQGVSYPHSLRLVATSAGPTKRRAPIWSVNVSVDELTNDRRHYLYLLKAAQAYVGKATEENVRVVLKRGDPGVAFLRTGRGLPKQARSAPTN